MARGGRNEKKRDRIQKGREERKSSVVSRIRCHTERLKKIQLECGVKGVFEVGHGVYYP